jgi:hypothetical protein
MSAIEEQTTIYCEGVEGTVGELNRGSEFEQVSLQKSRDPQRVLDLETAVLAIERLGDLDCRTVFYDARF